MSVRLQLARRLPVLRQTHGDEIGRLEAARKAFVRDYSDRKLGRLPIDGYASGLGKGTFCYRVERELDGLGRILGTPAPKFGVYFSKSENRYVYTSIWGNSPQGAYNRLREAILKLLRDAAAGDIKALNESRISPMFKGKILHLYFPERFAPIYSPDHLKHFVSCLNLVGVRETSIERQQALMEFRRQEPLLRDESPALMMRFLYDEFPPVQTVPEPADGEDQSAPKVSLGEALTGLQELSALPSASGPSTSPSPPKPGKFDANDGRRKFTGDRGEHIVAEFERRRLRAAGRPDLAKQVDHVAATDDSQGFDVLSFDEDGTPRRIEVKATSGKDLGCGFYLTENERRASQEKSNYYLCFVFHALSANPRLFMMKHPNLSGSEFTLRPTQYHVSINKT